jgi:tetratricopeptide (TPR) repeat protein
MIRLPMLLLFMAFTSTLPEMLGEYRLKLKANTLYEARAYNKAEADYRQLLTTAPAGKQTSIARFNLACCFYMQGKYADAAALFEPVPASKAEKGRRSPKSLFNAGNALSMMALGESNKSRKTELYRTALARFRSSLLQEPDDGDAKINYEIVRRYLKELENPDPPRSSESNRKQSAESESGVGIDVASRLLENAQQNESQLMRQIPRPGNSALEEKNNKKESQDW